MSIIDNLKALVTGRTPRQQLTQIREKIAAGVAELKRLDEEIGRRALARVQGDPEAARIAADCEAQQREIRERLAVLREAEARLVAKAAGDAEAARLAELAAMPRRRAEMIAEFLAENGELRAIFQDAGERLRRQLARAGAIAAELDGRANSPFQPTLWTRRFRSALAHHFQIDPMAAGAHKGETNLLGLTCEWVGGGFFRDIDEIDRDLLDDLCPLYLTEAAAREAVARRAVRNRAAYAAAGHEQRAAQIGREASLTSGGSSTTNADRAKAGEQAYRRALDETKAGASGIDAIVACAGEVFTLIRHDQMFGSRREAERAIQVNSLWRDGGFVVIDFGGVAAVVRTELAEIIAPLPAPAKEAA